MPDLSGAVFLDKPHGWTSRKAVNQVSRLFTPAGKKRIKAGHTGTLDPLATGMLPILLGEATRFASSGLEADKTYSFTMNLNIQTNTLDSEGDVISRFNVCPERAHIETTLASFTGKQQQIPPAFSAIHTQGKRAFELARKGETVTLAARNIEVYEMTLLDYHTPEVSVRVRTSKGTYVRALARDIGASLNAGGCITQLRRISTAGWPEKMMVTYDQLAEHREVCILQLAEWLHHLPSLHLDDVQAQRFAHGQRIQLNTEASGVVRVFDHQASLIGTAELKLGMQRMVLHPLKVLASSQQPSLESQGVLK